MLKPVRVTHAECSNVVASGLRTTKDRCQLRVATGTEVTYKYIESGSVTLAESNVTCEGGDVWLEGRSTRTLWSWSPGEGCGCDRGGGPAEDQRGVSAACAIASSGCEQLDASSGSFPSGVVPVYQSEAC